MAHARASAYDGITVYMSFTRLPSTTLEPAAPTASFGRLAEVLRVLMAVSQQAASTADLATVIQATADALHSQLHYERVAVYLAESETDDLALCALAGVSMEQIPATAYHARTGVGVTGLAVSSRHSVCINDFLLHPEAKSVLWPDLIEAELSVPIHDAGRVTGALTVGASQPNAYGPLHEAELSAVAEQLAAAIRAAEARRREHDRAAREALLTHLSHVVNRSLSLNDLLSEAVSAVGNGLKADRCTLSLIDLAEQVLITDHEYVNPMMYERRSLKRRDPLTGSLANLARTLQSGEVVEMGAQTVHPQLGDYGKWLTIRYGIQSLVWLPIPSPITHQLYTLSLMQVTHARPWSEDDIELLRGISDQISLALRNAQLFESVRQTAAELKAKNAELEAFVYTVSHDLQAPVVSLRGFASLLQTRYQSGLDERGQAYIARIGANADFLSRLLHDLLELSRVGRKEEPDETIAVQTVLEEVLGDIGHMLSERGIRLVLPKTWPTVQYSRVRLRQVFSNLLTNAIKFMGLQSAPCITVDWHLVPHGITPEIEFSVKDNGIGIHPDYQQRIFTLFERLKQVEVEGTGVGLSIVKRIIESRGGSVRVMSEPGAGATFFFTIPAGAPAVKA